MLWLAAQAGGTEAKEKEGLVRDLIGSNPSASFQRAGVQKTARSGLAVLIGNAVRESQRRGAGETAAGWSWQKRTPQHQKKSKILRLCSLPRSRRLGGALH